MTHYLNTSPASDEELPDREPFPTRTLTLFLIASGLTLLLLWLGGSWLGGVLGGDRIIHPLGYVMWMVSMFLPVCFPICVWAEVTREWRYDLRDFAVIRRLEKRLAREHAGLTA